MRFVFVGLLVFAGCQQAATTAPGDNLKNAKVLKIRVADTGQITADGEPITLDQLAVKLKDLKQAEGVVWYWRANPAAREPPPNATEVIKLVIENKLPIRLSTEPDFSDVVDDKGVSRPSK